MDKDKEQQQQAKGYSLEELAHLKAINEVKQAFLTEQLVESYQKSASALTGRGSASSIGNIGSAVGIGISTVATGMQMYRNIRSIIGLFRR